MGVLCPTLKYITYLTKTRLTVEELTTVCWWLVDLLMEGWRGSERELEASSHSHPYSNRLLCHWDELACLLSQPRMFLMKL